MKASPREGSIIMGAPMVRAILACTKSQTRRVVKWRDLEPGLNLSFSGLGVERTWSAADGAQAWVLGAPTRSSWEWRSKPTRCPYGQPGDRLWVREAWSRDCDHHWIMYRADLSAQRRAGVEVFDGCAAEELNPNAKWKPSIHMRRSDSRILLEVTDVRVERLQEISEADALAEGIEHLPRMEGYGLPDGSHFHCTDPRVSYWSLWNAINGRGSVEKNPLVWAVSFRRIDAGQHSPENALDPELVRAVGAARESTRGVTP